MSELELSAQVGVHEPEHSRTQVLGFDIEAVAQTSETDDLRDTVDYSAMVAEIHRVLSNGHITLIETVAQRVASGILAMPKVLEVRVQVTKPGALVGTKKVGVIVSGKRPLSGSAPATLDLD